MKKHLHKLKKHWIHTFDEKKVTDLVQEEKEEIEIFYSDPTVLGLFGLALSMFVSAMFKFIERDPSISIVLICVLIVAGIAQLIAAHIDFYKNNFFGSTVFGVYGLMRLGLACQALIGLKTGLPAENMTGIVLIAIEIATLFFTIAALHLNKIFGLMFVSINIVLITNILIAFDVNVAMMSSMNFASECMTAGIAAYATFVIFVNNSLAYKIHISMGNPLWVWGYHESKTHKIRVRSHSYLLKLQFFS